MTIRFRTAFGVSVVFALLFGLPIFVTLLLRGDTFDEAIGIAGVGAAGGFSMPVAVWGLVNMHPMVERMWGLIWKVWSFLLPNLFSDNRK